MAVQLVFDRFVFAVFLLAFLVFDDDGFFVFGEVGDFVLELRGLGLVFVELFGVFLREDEDLVSVGELDLLMEVLRFRGGW